MPLAQLQIRTHGHHYNCYAIQVKVENDGHENDEAHVLFGHRSEQIARIDDRFFLGPE
jgi:hypothetical protein